jgi:cell division protein FtsI/penicillin-binding protein 2
MYTSTVANNGVRYKASLLSKIMNYSLTETVLEYEPVVLNKINISKSVYSDVKDGMLSATLLPHESILIKY